MVTIDLVSAPTDTKLEVLEINAGITAKKRLISMGIHTGDKLIKYNGASWGPVLVKNITLNSTKIAIGRRLAAKIRIGYAAKQNT
jgi:Fe2+ transport system protein FeoA